nr:hypothetical protein [Thermoflexibacter sp.]
QPGEVFSPSILSSGLNRRSVWFKFTIASTRSVTVNLQQPASVIQAGNVGFTVWKTSACLPAATQVSNKLTPIETFGKTFHPCVELGEYYVQVSANNNANGYHSLCNIPKINTTKADKNEINILPKRAIFFKNKA